MRAVTILPALLAAACSAPLKEPEEPVQPVAHLPERETEPLIENVTRALKKRDLAHATTLLERGRWHARDRGRAALLLCGCRLAGGDYASAMEGLREYLAKTTRVKSSADRLAIKLLRHHASGGGLSAENAVEACYMGLYALMALKEPRAAEADLAWARREAPEPERLLVDLVKRPPGP